MWKELAQEFPEVVHHCVEQTLEQEARRHCIQKDYEYQSGSDLFVVYVRRHQP